MAPSRIPPTRFGPPIGQPAGAAARPGVRVSSPPPPPTRFGPGAVPAPPRGAAVLRKAALPVRGRGGTLQRMEQGTPTTSQKMAEKPCGVCTMGEGMGGPLTEVILHSSGFSSCGPIIMYNWAEQTGGLFHFAAGSLKEQAGALQLMLKELRPTEVHIPKRDELSDGTWDGMMPRDARRDESGQPDDDGAILERFFKDTCGFKGTLKTSPRGEKYYVTAGASGNLVITTDFAPGPVSAYVDHADIKKLRLPSEAYALAQVTAYGRKL